MKIFHLKGVMAPTIPLSSPLTTIHIEGLATWLTAWSPLPIYIRQETSPINTLKSDDQMIEHEVLYLSQHIIPFLIYLFILFRLSICLNESIYFAPPFRSMFLCPSSQHIIPFLIYLFILFRFSIYLNESIYFAPPFCSMFLSPSLLLLCMTRNDRVKIFSLSYKNTYFIIQIYKKKT